MWAGCDAAAGQRPATRNTHGGDWSLATNYVDVRANRQALANRRAQRDVTRARGAAARRRRWRGGGGAMAVAVAAVVAVEQKSMLTDRTEQVMELAREALEDVLAHIVA